MRLRSETVGSRVHDFRAADTNPMGSCSSCWEDDPSGMVCRGKSDVTGSQLLEGREPKTVMQ